jgi:hypothetical protein
LDCTDPLATRRVDGQNARLPVPQTLELRAAVGLSSLAKATASKGIALVSTDAHHPSQL